MAANPRRAESPFPMITAMSFRCAIASLVVLALSALPSAAENAKDVLAPTGRLRVGVYHGSPTSMIADPKSGQIHGLTYDLGREFAKRLGVPVEYATFPRIADVIVAIKNGQVDFTLTNASPARAQDVDFSQTLISVELGYLVPPNSTLAGEDQLDRPGVRIGVTKGGTSEHTLSSKFRNATIVPAESVKLGIQMLERGEIEVYATNKAILFEMSDAIAGARILDGSWGQEHMALAIPKGRDAATDTLKSFVRDVQASGLLAQMERQAGLRGAVIQADTK
jgi:polar amino acid transport system substrate-binding protein